MGRSSGITNSYKSGKEERCALLITLNKIFGNMSVLQEQVPVLSKHQFNAVPNYDRKEEGGRILWFSSKHLSSWSHSLLENFGGLSFMSVSVMVTVVVPDKPPMWPPMSLAWMTTRYSSLISRSIPRRATFMVPVDQDSSKTHEWIYRNRTDRINKHASMQKFARASIAEGFYVGLFSLNVQWWHSEVDTTEQVHVQKSAVFVV